MVCWCNVLWWLWCSEFVWLWCSELWCGSVVHCGVMVVVVQCVVCGGGVLCCGGGVVCCGGGVVCCSAV